MSAKNQRFLGYTDPRCCRTMDTGSEWRTVCLFTPSQPKLGYRFTQLSDRGKRAWTT